MGNFVRLAAACLLAPLLLPAPAQTPAPSQPLVKVTTHLVTVNVVVHGKKNEPVDDLTKDDFTIFDNKQAQQIASFSMESVKVAQEKTKTLAPLPQNTFTNRAELRPKAPNSV